MSLSGMCFASSDTVYMLIFKLIPLPQYMFLRGLLITCGTFALAKRSKMPFPREPQIVRWMLLRGLLEIYTAFAFLTTLRHLPLAEATAIIQTVPLVMTVLAFLLFGERFGIWRLSGILLGLLGVLLIIKPGFGEFNIFYLLNFSVVLSITARDFLSRHIPRSASSTWVAFVTAVVVTIATGIISIMIPWVALSGKLVIALLASGFFVVFGQLLSIIAMRLGEVGLVAPFRYIAIVFAVIIDVVIFHNIPDWLTVLGCALVAVAGIIVLYREAQLSASRR